MLFGLTGHTDEANVLDALDSCLAIIEFKPDGTILNANENFCAALGYGASDLAGKHHGMLCEPDYVASPAYAAFWQKLGRGDADSAEYLRCSKSGQKIWVKASYTPVKDRSGKVYKVVKIVTDVSSNLSAFGAGANALDRSNVLSALDTSLAIIEFKPDGTIIWANRNFCQALGYDLTEIQSRHHSLFCDKDYVASSDYSDFWRTLNNGEFQAAQYLRYGKNGKEVWIQATYNPVKDPTGKVYKVVKCATDITGRVVSVNMIGQGLKELAANNLDFRLAEMKDQAFSDLREDFNHSVWQQANSIIGVTNTAQSIDRLVREIADASTDLAKRTEQQAAAVEQTNGAVSQVLNTVKLSSERASAANRDASEAGEVAAQSGVVMNEAIKAIKNIAQSSTEIGQIIGVIDEIAFQTNLLALNAGVEAARAGDAGRGFAVVAQEVRSLAQRSAQAAKEIKSLISNSSEHVRQGVALVDQSGKALNEIVTKVTQVGKQIAEIAEASKQQAASLSEVVAAVNQIDQMTQHNAAMAEESSAAVVNVTNDTRNLADLVAQFKTIETARSQIDNEVGARQDRLRRALTAKPIRTSAKQGQTANNEPRPATPAPSKAVGDDWSEF